MGRRIRYAVCGVVGATLAIGGCTGGDDPPSPPSSSPPGSSTSASGSATSSASGTSTAGSGGPSSTATTSPTGSLVDLPKAAQAHTHEGAEEFVKFFVEQSNLASRKADTTLLPPLFDPGCMSCKAIQDHVVELKAKEERYESNPVELVAADAVDGGLRGQQLVRLRMVQRPARVVDVRGKVVSTDPRAELARTASLVWKEDRWIVYGIAQ